MNKEMKDELPATIGGWFSFIAMAIGLIAVGILAIVWIIGVILSPATPVTPGCGFNDYGCSRQGQ